MVINISYSKFIITLIFSIILAACGGGGGGGSPQNQTITFANIGPVDTTVDATTNNVASGGGGTGAISYSSSDASIATVNGSTGAVTAVAVGTVTITANKDASSGYNSASAFYTVNVSPGSQAIVFTQVGPLQTLGGSTLNNTASGGAGTGAITYAGDAAAVATVDSTTGAVQAINGGTVTITATKAADANYNQAQVSYQLTVEDEATFNAWVGSANSEIMFPAFADGTTFARSNDRNCDLNNVGACANGQSNILSGSSVVDTAMTLSTTAYYNLKNNGGTSNQLVANATRFSPRIGHGAVFFNNRYWVIGGGRSDGTYSYLKADVWASDDGAVWELITTSGMPGNWFGQYFAFNNKLWAFAINAGEVWTSVDGANWINEAGSVTGLPSSLPNVTAINIVEFNSELWLTYQGTSYSSPNGLNWTQRSALGAIGGTAVKNYATLSSFNGSLYLIGGSVAGTTENTVWASADGITWTSTTAAFSSRTKHMAFVLGNKLWVMGGATIPDDDSTATGDMWSSTDGITWIEEANTHLLDRSYWSKVVVNNNTVTLIGGLRGGYSNKVWQTTDGSNWIELSPYAEFTPRLTAKAVEFNGELWLIGGADVVNGTTNDIWRSTDGNNWTKVVPNGAIFTPLQSHAVTVFNNQLWVTGGVNYTNGVMNTPKNEVWSSSDGINWTQHMPSGAIFDPRYAHEMVAFNNRLWVIGGEVAEYSPGSTFEDIWSTDNGVDWVEETANADFGLRTSHQIVAYNNELWLFGGGDGVSALDDVWKSSDAINWTLVTAITPKFSPRFGHQVVVHNNKMWLIGGVDSTDYNTSIRKNDVWSTVDGATWVEETAAAQFDPRWIHSVVTFNNQMWLMGGFNLTRYNDVWRSSDGVNWRLGFKGTISAP